MATSIASQLQAIRSIVKADTDTLKRPFTRPSILFDAKEAADIDLDALFDLAQSGLEALVTQDERFAKYKNDLFAHKSKELDRELMGVEENNQINATISSYLRLLSGHFQSPSALRTLEYLIRRYKIYVYNTDELILCALPYHDTHVFVRIVQLLDTGHGKWAFLEGVKISGAPPPRKVIVQQCIRDMGVLEALCNYASPAKKVQPSRPVISFCTAVVIEVLGSLPAIDSDAVKRILPYVVSSLQIHSKGNTDHKAGALMIVGLLASRSTLSSSLIKSLIRSVADVARDDAEHSTDLQLFRVSFMALVNVVQFQSVEVLSKKVVDILKEIRDLTGILSGLTKEFNIDKFLAVLLESLMEYSFEDDMCHQALLSMIETVPVNALAGRLVSKVLSISKKLYKKGNETSSTAAKSKLKQILVSINVHYSLELREAVRSSLEDIEVKSKKDNSAYEILCKALDGGLDSSASSDSKIWFGLEHPKATVRRATVMSLDADSSLGEKPVNSQKLQTLNDALLRRIYDDDLSVVQAVLSMKRLSEFIKHSDLLDGLQKVLKRCTSILFSKGSDNTTLAADITESCIKHVIASLSGQEGYAKELAAMIFPLILATPKSQKTNMAALSAAKELKWPLYHGVDSSSEQKLTFEKISDLNMRNIDAMAEYFSANFDEHVRWFVGYCDDLESSKTLFFMILLHALMKPQKDFGQFSALYESCFPIVLKEWDRLEAAGFGISTEESIKTMLDNDCKAFLDNMHDMGFEELNAEILICIFRRLLDAFFATTCEDVSKDENKKREVILHKFFSFFASHSKVIFKEHLHQLVSKQKSSPASFLSSLFTDESVAVTVQKESLHSFAFICFQLEERIRLENEIDESLLLQLPAEFPSILVPLSSDDQEIRSAAMSCVEGLLTLWPHVSLSGGKNGRSAVWSHFLGEILAMMVQQKKLIVSDTDFLSEFFTTLLSSSHHGLLVPHSVGERFDRPTKDSILKFILCSALSLCPYGIMKIVFLLQGLGNQVMQVKEVNTLLHDLLERRKNYHTTLSKIQVKVLCLLLECCMKLTSASVGHSVDSYILKALQVDRSYSEDFSIIQPCATVLRCLNSSLYGGFKPEIQELLFQELVCVFRSCNGEIQNAARTALLQIKVSSSTIHRMLDFVLEKAAPSTGTPHGKKKKKATTQLKSELHNDVGHRGCSKLSFLSSLLDVLLLKKDIENRTTLVEPLFKHLNIVFTDKEWINEAVKQDEQHAEASSDVSQSTLCYIQQNLLSVLEDITNSLIVTDRVQDGIVESFDIKLLVSCVRSTDDAATRNHVFSLLSAVARVMPDIVLDHILDILTVIGQSAVTQWDSHSKKVFEDLVSTIVPCWLSKTENQEELLQVFLDILPDVAQHRRLSIVEHLLRTLGETSSLASVLILLFRSLASYQDNTLEHVSASVRTQWQYTFALQISGQYSCSIWLPSLVLMLQKLEMESWDPQLVVQILVAMQFINDKLQDPEISFKLKSGGDDNSIQETCGALMKHVATYLQLVGSKRKDLGVPASLGKELKELMHAVLTSVRKGLLPSTYFQVIITLLGHADLSLRKKALGLLCDVAKECSTLTQKHNKKVVNPSIRSSWLLFDEITSQHFEKMCQEILKIVDDSADTSKQTSLRLSAVSTLEVLVTVFPSSDSVFNTCLATVIKHIHSDDLAVSSGCFRTVGALINVLGPRSLPELPSIMDNVFKRCHAVSLCDNSEPQDSETSKESLFMSILVTVEAVIDKLGGFLNPYLGQILQLLILRSQYANNSSSKLKLKADAVRKLITERVAVRLLLPPLLKIYSEAVQFGDSSLSITFQMLGDFISTMDRSSVSAFYLSIFDTCLLALDIRRQRPTSVKNITAVEKEVINAMVVLTAKLTENMFKPLFIRCVEWSEYVEQNDDLGLANVDRAISFFSLTQKLVSSHRSLFVPYFKYILNGLVRHLTDEVAKSGPSQKKKAKLTGPDVYKSQENSSLSVGKWHVRALVLSSLHKCFLYDAGNLAFLDSSNFQVLLKPIISQLVVDPPTSLEDHPDVPSVNEVDDVLVSCVGQMAVTSASDLLWKPLNHEVLMQTRSEKVRTRILGLKIVKFLVDNLREEYLVFLPETIPFLGELLEDVESNVKLLAQEILKEMESTSGESLRQYL
ncbi:putative U3 small nucleolar RNA-associated protein [Helianthus annuus]|uniref:Putative ARM repeat superfamily protein n=1 Tax=Helianthus annuus TaxID=4232 RepID=A0A251UMR9_HELAN|nr:uncharacterized protein At3g06530 [Helianthus annuus]KAF5805582.1 putative U3 small nucleolar RNA-associated protein [Helianthus annuus]KAJ0569993.1 putative U3 small nucleolar RNA-associated protein [Helianthus annuus]KAJ0576695.1 putative U3 small nucleolar RNA-associated protein [Helianthus annuus]KAJ0584322.1 putative U3 small nucleolar RNA-associated protein [Helianthus annuus]KAJ0746954.1 putative U3 small nucleolar RNA-associated protein [Helianthus annuus]